MISNVKKLYNIATMGGRFIALLFYYPFLNKKLKPHMLLMDWVIFCMSWGSVMIMDYIDVMNLMFSASVILLSRMVIPGGS